MNLFKIALIFSLIGIFIILVMANNQDISKTDIKNINRELLGKDVKVEGEVESLYEGGDFLIITVSDNTAKIKVVIFDKNSFRLSEGEDVEVIGEVEEYKGSLEINADFVEIR